MTNNDDPPEMIRLKALTQSNAVAAIAVYQVRGIGNSVQLQIWRTLSPYAKTPEDHQVISNSLLRQVLRCCQLDTNAVLPPHPRFVPDPQGRRPWNIVIGSGAVRRAGYAIGAAVPAVDPSEAKLHIAQIDSLFDPRSADGQV